MKTADFLTILSTLSQSTSTLAGLIFVAIQFQIEWLNQKVTRKKSAIISIITSGDKDADLQYYKDSWETSTTLHFAEKIHPKNEVLQINIKALNLRLEKLQAIRKSSKLTILVLLGLTFAFLVQMPFARTICESTCLCVIISSLNLFAVGISLCLCISTIRRALTSTQVKADDKLRFKPKL